MTVGRLQLMLHIFLIILLDVSGTGNLQQVVAVIHQLTKGVQSLDNLCNISDDSFLVLIVGRNLRHEMVHDGGIDTKLHLLRINKHELQFVRMLLVKQRCDDGIQSNRFTLTCSTSHQQMRYLGQVNHEHIIRNGLTQSNGQIHGCLAEPLGVQDTLHRDNLRFLVGYLDTYGSLTRNWCNDTNTQGTQTQGDIILQIADSGDAHTFCWSDLIECNGRTDGGMDRTNLYTETVQYLYDTVHVTLLLILINRRFVAIVVFLQQVEGGELILQPRLTGIDRRTQIYFCRNNLAIGFLLSIGHLHIDVNVIGVLSSLRLHLLILFRYLNDDIRLLFRY